MTTYEFDTRCQSVSIILPHDAAGVPPILRQGVALVRLQAPQEALALLAPNIPTQQSLRSLTIFESIAVCHICKCRKSCNTKLRLLPLVVIFTCSRCLFPAFPWANGKCEQCDQRVSIKIRKKNVKNPQITK